MESICEPDGDPDALNLINRGIVGSIFQNFDSIFWLGTLCLKSSYKGVVTRGMLAGKSILLEAEKEAEKRRNKSLQSKMTMLGSPA